MELECLYCCGLGLCCDSFWTVFDGRDWATAMADVPVVPDPDPVADLNMDRDLAPVHVPERGRNVGRGARVLTATHSNASSRCRSSPRVAN